MPHLIGPDFIGIQAEDLDAARTFYTEVVGLKVAADSPPGPWCSKPSRSRSPFAHPWST
jgi:catechol 2,3-dioxygenase-like lactoylglutathione lyase family enzyme